MGKSAVFPPSLLEPDGTVLLVDMGDYLHQAVDEFRATHRLVAHQLVKQKTRRTPEEWFELFVEFARPRPPLPRLSTAQSTLLLTFKCLDNSDLTYWYRVLLRERRTALSLDKMGLVRFRKTTCEMQITQQGLRVWKELQKNDPQDP